MVAYRASAEARRATASDAAVAVARGGHRVIMAEGVRDLLHEAGSPAHSLP